MSGAEAAKPLIQESRSDEGSASEPSMDEILASIRQIISDQTRDSDEAATRAAEVVANPQVDESKVDSIIGALATDHWSVGKTTENTSNNPQPTDDQVKFGREAPGVDADQTGLTSTDYPGLQVSASLEDLIEPGKIVPEVRPPVSSFAPVDLPKTLPEPAADRMPAKAGNNVGSALDRLIARRSDDIPVLPARIENPVSNQANATENLEGALQDEISSHMVRPRPAPVREPEKNLKNPPVAHTPLLSEETTFGVSEKFEQLALSMLEGRKSEMDAMMTEIMRPMLRDWLEDNLPSLVERLVREEIERVSRGVHR